MRKASGYNEILQLLQKLHSAFPTHTMGMHLSTALDEYGDLWGVTDKEILFALTKYKANLEMDSPNNIIEIDDILKDGMDLDNILKEEENGEDY